MAEGLGGPVDPGMFTVDYSDEDAECPETGREHVVHDGTCLHCGQPVDADLPADTEGGTWYHSQWEAMHPVLQDES